MLRPRYLIPLCCLLLGACTGPKPATDISLPAIFSDHMVFQRNQAIPVWGWASPGDYLSVSVGDQQIETTVYRDSTWRVDLSPLEAGGPYELTVSGAETVTFTDMLAGEVWLASGQSNMEWRLSNVNNAEQEIASAVYPDIRLFTVQRDASAFPLRNVNSEGWAAATPETAASFSAVAYFFGRMLHQELQIPVGLIHSSWGGTPVEAWTSGATLKTFPEFLESVELLEGESRTGETLLETVNRQREEWTQSVAKSDIGYENGAPVWAHPDFDFSAWDTISLPGLWENEALPAFDGIVWFKKEIVLPDSWDTGELELQLGRIDDADSTWFNDTLVGGINNYNAPRRYTIPAEATRSGRNIITVRVLDTGGGGGIYGEADELLLVPSGDSNLTPISLAGVWAFRPASDFSAMNPPRFRSPGNSPTALYNAMIHPLIPYALRGAIWYQGEANVNQAYLYRSVFPSMIYDWRVRWNLGDFPFLFVQLANYGERLSDPVQEHPWAELREEQLRTLGVPNTGMAVTIDIGESGDIHPRNKQDVGKRLALPALYMVYEKDITYSGPIFTEMDIEGNLARLHFDHIGDGLAVRGDRLQGFAVAGPDSVFVHADARIEGEHVIVSSQAVQEPIAVRYAWALNPRANLYNAEGLPASPFRTDNWPAVTER